MFPHILEMWREVERYSATFTLNYNLPRGSMMITFEGDLVLIAIKAPEQNIIVYVLLH